VVASRADFQWMTGFECSAFPQVGVDELEATQHDRWWASDLVRLRDVGITLVRYGIPWHRVNPRPHQYDWSWTDQALDLMETLGITPIVDLFHFGTPLWVDGGIMHPIFGEVQGWYARAFAERYPRLRYYTPTNEPYICAVFGAEQAVWYPFLRERRDTARALKNVAEGVCRAMAEIRQVRPDALMMLSDTCEEWHAPDGAFAEEAAFRSARRFLVHDLYQGHVDRDHPLRAWLAGGGLDDRDLDWFCEHPVELDLLGLDYYPQSERQLRRGPGGERVEEPAEGPAGFAELARQYSDRYGGIPVALAETNLGGPVSERVRWLDGLVEQTRKARAAGVPVAGITWYGAVDHVDWDSLLRVRSLRINPCGMWSLRRQGDRLVREPTALVERFRQYLTMPLADSVGELASTEAAARVRAVLAPAAGGP
jgi:beta-glucosidase/6-phospho-beta-glucosidase/beta-galactosidase